MGQEDSLDDIFGVNGNPSPAQPTVKATPSNAGGSLDDIFGVSAPASMQAPQIRGDAPKMQSLQVAPVKSHPSVYHPVITPVGDSGGWADFTTARRLQMAREEAESQGISTKGWSFGRTEAEQANIRGSNQYAAKGRSNHTNGFSVDAYGTPEYYAKLDPIMEKYGLAPPLRNNPAYPNGVEDGHYTDQANPNLRGYEKIWGDDDPRMIAAKKLDYPQSSPQKLLAIMAAGDGYDPGTIAKMERQIDTESGFNPAAHNPDSGAHGAPQFMDSTLAPILQKRGYTSDDYNKNISVQLRCYLDHMGDLLKANKGDIAGALSDYNAGSGGTAAQRFLGKSYNETQKYVQNILGCSPEEANDFILKRQQGPLAMAPQTDEVQQKTRQEWANQASAGLNMVAPPAALPYEDPMAPTNHTPINYEDMPGAVGDNPLATMIDTGLTIKAQQTGLSKPMVAYKDAQNYINDAIRGMTVGMLSTGQLLAENADKLPYFMGGGKGSIDDWAGKNLVGPMLGWGAYKIKEPEFRGSDGKPVGWLAPEREQLDAWRGGQSAVGWAGNALAGAVGRGNGQSKFDANSLAANAMSLGNELPALAGGLVFFELSGLGKMTDLNKVPRALGPLMESPLVAALPPGSVVAKGAQLATSGVGAAATGLGKLAGSGVAKSLAETTARGFGMEASAGSNAMHTAASWMSSVAPQLAAKAGPQFFHELSTMMNVFGAQAAVQGFGEALAQKKTPQEAVAAALMNGIFGGLFAAGMHLGSGATSGLFQAAAKGALPEMQAAAEKLNGDIGGYFNGLMDKLNDPTNQFNQSIRNRMLDKVIDWDKQSTGGFSAWAINTLKQLAAQTREQHAMQVQQKFGKQLGDVVTTMTTGLQNYMSYWMDGSKNAIQSMQEAETSQQMLATWQQKNAIFTGDPRITEAMKMIDTGAMTGASSLDPAIQKAWQKLGIGAADIKQMQIWEGLQNSTKSAMEKANGLKDFLDPIIHMKNMQDMETYNVSIQNVKAMAAYISGATEDLKLDGPTHLPPGSKNDAIAKSLMDNMAQGIKDDLASSAGLANKLPKVMADRIRLMTSSLQRFGGSNPTSAMHGAISDLDSRISDLQKVIDYTPGRPPTASGIYTTQRPNGTFENTPSKVAFEYADQKYAADNAGIPEAQRAASIEQKQLIQQRDSISKMAATIDNGDNISDRITRQLSGEGGEQFKQALKNNNLLTSENINGEAGSSTLNGMYRALTDERQVRNPENAWDSFKNDPGNKRDAQAARKYSADYKTFKETIKSEVSSDAAALFHNDPSEPIFPEQKEWMAKEFARRLDRDPRSPIYSEEVKQEFLKAHDGDGMVNTRVPAAWLDPGETSKGNIKGLKDSQAYRPDRSSGSTPLNKSFLVTGAGDGKLCPLDGNARAILKANQQVAGDNTVAVTLRKSQLNDLLATRLPDYHDAIMEAMPGGVNAIGAANSKILGDARNAFLGMSYDEATERSQDALRAIADESDAKYIPSGKSLATVQGDKPMSPWASNFGPYLQAFMEQNQVIRKGMEDYVSHLQPTSPRQAQARAYSCLEDFATRGRNIKDISDQIGGELAKRLDGFARENSMPEFKSYLRDGKLPEVFNRQLADAYDSLPGDGKAMQEMIRKYPPLQEVMGPVFDMMKVLESFKVGGEDLQDMFRQGYWPQIFRGMNAEEGAAKKGLSSFQGSALRSENLRKVQNFSQARELNATATTNLRNANWPNVGIDLKKAPLTDAGRIAWFNKATETNQRKLFAGPDTVLDGDGNPTLTPKQKYALNSVQNHINLTDPVLDPVMMIRSQIHSVMRADLVRSTLKRMSLIPVAGEQDGLTMLHHLEEGSQVPQVTRTDNGKDASYVPVTNLVGSGKLKMGGEEGAISTDKLYVHPQVAEQLQKYFDGGGIDPTFWKAANEFSKRLALMGGSAKYGVRLLMNHAGSVFDAMNNNLSGSEWNKNQNYATLPANLVHLGKAAQQNGEFFMRARMLGLNVDHVDGVAKNLAPLWESLMHDPQAEGRSATEQILAPGTMASKWEEVKAAEGLGQKLSTLASFGLTGARATERLIARQAIEDAAVGAHAYHENLFMEGAFKPLVASGQLTYDAARRLAGQQAAEMVNRNMGMMNTYLSNRTTRNLMSNSPLGAISVVPGVLRTEIANFVAATGESWSGKSTWTHKGVDDLQGASNFIRQRAMGTLKATMTAGVLGAQMLQMGINGSQYALGVAQGDPNAALFPSHPGGPIPQSLQKAIPTLANFDPNNPYSALMVRAGSKQYDLNLTGWATRYVHAVLDPMGGVEGMARAFQNQLSPMATIPVDLASNTDRIGRPITDPMDGGPAGLKNRMREVGYILNKSINLDQVSTLLGGGPQNLNPVERMLAAAGVNGQQVPTPETIEAQSARAYGVHEKFMFDQISPLMRDYRATTDAGEQDKIIDQIRHIGLASPVPMDNVKMGKLIQSLKHQVTGTTPEDMKRRADISTRKAPKAIRAEVNQQEMQFRPSK